MEGSLLKQFSASEKSAERVIGYGCHIARFEEEDIEIKKSPHLLRYDCIEKLILSNILTSLPLYPRSVLHEVFGFNEKLKARQEWDLNLRIVALGYEFAHDGVLVYKQRHHGAPQRISNRKLNLEEELGLLMCVYESLPSPKKKSVNDA